MSEVLETKSGFLFLSGGNHSIFNLFSGENITNNQNIFKKYSDIYLKNIVLRKRICDNNNIKYFNIVFPEKAVAFSSQSELIDFGIESLYINAYLALNLKIGDHTMYPLELLSSSDCWMRTDTHLSPKGRLCVSEEIGNSKALFDVKQVAINKQKFDDLPSEIVKKEFAGDLGKKFQPHREELVLSKRIHNRSSGFIIANNGMSSGNEGIIEITSNPQAVTDLTLLIFGDSFMRQQLPSLALLYKKIIFMRTRYFHREVLNDIRPNHIITSCAERYLSAVSPDNEAPKFYTYPYIKRKALDPSENFFDLWSEVTSK